MSCERVEEGCNFVECVQTCHYDMSIFGSKAECGKQAFSLKRLVALCHILISSQDVIKAERCILDTIGWQVNQTSPLPFVKIFTKLIESVWPDIISQNNLSIEVAFSFAEIAIHHPELTNFTYHESCDSGIKGSCARLTSSKIAYTSIFLSMQLMTESLLTFRRTRLVLAKV